METITRICLTGPESTGKSELAKELARHYGAPVVPEYARRYVMEQGNNLTYEDVEPIARGVIAALESAAPALGVGMTIHDTDLISTVVYSRHYYGRVHDWIVEEARRRKAGLYLLMDTDIPWQPDPARDAGGDVREDLFDAFHRALDEFDCRFIIVSGSRETRLATAVAAIDALAP